MSVLGAFKKPYIPMIIRLIILLLIVGCEEVLESIKEGCMDSYALNYDTDANKDNGSCEYLPFYEFTDFTTINGMDEFGNPTNKNGDGIAGGCLFDNQFINKESLYYINVDSLIVPIEALDSLHVDSFFVTLDDIILANDTTGGIVVSTSLDSLVFSNGLPISLDSLVFSNGLPISDTSVVVIDIILAGNTNGIVVSTSLDSLVIAWVKIKTTLKATYPNPFHSIISINYSIDNDGHVEIMIYDTAGSLVEQLVNGHQNVGYYSFVWDATNYPDGYYRVIADFGDIECFHNIHKKLNP